MRVISPQKMKEMEQYAICRLDYTELDLMTNAANGLKSCLQELCGKRILMLVGTGNNGGDVLAAAYFWGEIAEKNKEEIPFIDIVMIDGGHKLATLPAMFAEKIISMKNQGQLQKLSICSYADMGKHAFGELLSESDIVVDGLFGTGLKRAVEGDFAEVIELVNKSVKKSKDKDVESEVATLGNKKTVIAVDVPSGLDATNGVAYAASAIHADLCVTMQAVKCGCIMNDGPDYCGNLKVVSIFDARVDNNTIEELNTKFCEFNTMTNPMTEGSMFGSTLMRQLLNPPRNAHKGTFGKVLCVCGSNEMRGAAVFATKAASEIGAGIVYLASVQEVWDTCSVLCPEAIGVVLKASDCGGIDGFDDENRKRLEKSINGVDAVLVGPGMMCNDDGNTAAVVELVLKTAADSSVPVVIDADGLNALATSNIGEAQQPSIEIVTPHPGEMSRLLAATCGNSVEMSIAQVQRERIKVAYDYAKQSGRITVLKGCGTVICDTICNRTSDNHVCNINSTGSPSLSTAGSGDLLAGMICGLIARLRNVCKSTQSCSDVLARKRVYEIVVLATYLHGRLGEEAERDTEIGAITATPMKLINKLSKVLESEKNGNYEK